MSKAIQSDPQVMHGTPCFAGTRVPVRTLFDWIEEGNTIDFFLEQFPSVRPEQVVAVLQDASRRTVEEADGPR